MKQLALYTTMGIQSKDMHYTHSGRLISIIDIPYKVVPGCYQPCYKVATGLRQGIVCKCPGTETVTTLSQGRDFCMGLLCSIIH